MSLLHWQIPRLHQMDTFHSGSSVNSDLSHPRGGVSENGAAGGADDSLSSEKTDQISQSSQRRLHHLITDIMETHKNLQRHTHYIQVYTLLLFF